MSKTQIKSTKPSIEEKVTQRIIASLEKGVPAWVVPWSKVAPQNAQYSRCYSGLNMVLLGGETFYHGFNGWLTFRQIRELGGKVIKGEQSSEAILLKPIIREVTCEKTGEVEEKRFNIFRKFDLFNLSQTEGLPVELLEKFKISNMQDADNSSAEALAWQAVKFMKAKGSINISAGDQVTAFYRTSEDAVYLPESKYFASQTQFLATLFHELSHWTGHESRLNRGLGNGKYGDDAYAFEELVAELSASFLCAKFGIDSQLENSASYLKSWLKCLKEDSSFIFKAASEARKSADYLLGLIGGQLNDDLPQLEVSKGNKPSQTV